MIHNSLKESISIAEASTNDGNYDSPFCDLMIRIKSPGMRTKSNSVIKYKNSFTHSRAGPTYISRVHSMAKSILEKFGGKDTLNYQEFAKFISEYPKIFDGFSEIFKEDIWCLSDQDEDYFLPILCPKSKSLDERTNVGFSLAETNPLSHVDMWGVVYKKSENKDYFEKKCAILKKNLLMFLDNEYEAMPTGVVFTEGCYVNILNDYNLTNKFGISLSHHNIRYKEVNL